METRTKLLIGVGTAAAGVGGFVGFRLFVRSKAREALVEKHSFDKIFSTLESLERASGKDWNLPSFDEFVEGVVPIWSITMPEEAINDVFANGRASEFWPEKYREPANEKAEAAIFTTIRTLQANKGVPITEVLPTIASALTTVLTQK